MVRESSTTPRQGRKQTARAIMFLKRERKKERKKRENAVRMIEGGPGQEKSADGNILTPRAFRIPATTIAESAVPRYCFRLLHRGRARPTRFLSAEATFLRTSLAGSEISALRWLRGACLVPNDIYISFYGFFPFPRHLGGSFSLLWSAFLGKRTRCCVALCAVPAVVR